jgi:hypothetical protein
MLPLSAVHGFFARWVKAFAGDRIPDDQKSLQSEAPRTLENRALQARPLQLIDGLVWLRPTHELAIDRTRARRRDWKASAASLAG